MGMIAANLADLIRTDMGFPLPVSSQLTGWATAIVNEIQENARVNNASGTVTGICPTDGGPLSSGAANNGVISNLNGPRLASAVVSFALYGFVSDWLQIYCIQIVNHVQTGIVTFASGNITGNCSNTDLDSGEFTGGGSQGRISGLDGPTLASLIHNAIGYPGTVSVPLTEFCTAICNYIMDNADCSYSSGDCTGFAPADGGPMSNGVGVNGSIA